MSFNEKTEKLARVLGVIETTVRVLEGPVRVGGSVFAAIHMIRELQEGGLPLPYAVVATAGLFTLCEGVVRLGERGGVLKIR